jgi:hypothetical protein
MKQFIVILRVHTIIEPAPRELQKFEQFLQRIRPMKFDCSFPDAEGFLPIEATSLPLLTSA